MTIKLKIFDPISINCRILRFLFERVVFRRLIMTFEFSDTAMIQEGFKIMLTAFISIIVRKKINC